MPYAIKVEMLEPASIMPLSRKPDGVKVSGLSSEAFAGPGSDGVLYFIVDVTKTVALGVLSNWLYDYIKQFGAKRIRINGREPSDRAEFDRIISDIEIGKND